MVLNRREQRMAILTGMVAAALLLDLLVVSPYLDRRQSLARDRADAATKLSDADDIFTRQRHLRPVWMDLQRGGLQSDGSSAESQSLNAILRWAQWSGVELAALKPERTTQEAGFQVISFHVTANGPMSAVSKLLWSVETPAIPVRVNDLQIAPRKEGTDDLSVQLSISTLCQPPAAAKPAAKTSGGQS